MGKTLKEQLQGMTAPPMDREKLVRAGSYAHEMIEVFLNQLEVIQSDGIQESDVRKLLLDPRTHTVFLSSTPKLRRIVLDLMDTVRDFPFNVRHKFMTAHNNLLQAKR